MTAEGRIRRTPRLRKFGAKIKQILGNIYAMCGAIFEISEVGKFHLTVGDEVFDGFRREVGW